VGELKMSNKTKNFLILLSTNIIMVFYLYFDIKNFNETNNSLSVPTFDNLILLCVIIFFLVYAFMIAKFFIKGTILKAIIIPFTIFDVEMLFAFLLMISSKSCSTTYCGIPSVFLFLAFASFLFWGMVGGIIWDIEGANKSNVSNEKGIFLLAFDSNKKNDYKINTLNIAKEAIEKIKLMNYIVI
jgi:hypothetical protein